MNHLTKKIPPLPSDFHNGTCLLYSLMFTVVEKCTKQTAIEVVQNGDEEELIKFKGGGKLVDNIKRDSEFQ